MPMWCPPTPPSSDGDVYCDSWARALYRRGAAADALLPPVHRRERAARSPRRARPPARALHAPPSLFERAGPRQRARARPAPPAHRDLPQPDWAPCEDAALKRALRMQRLPAEPPAALAPNWEWLAELVNETSFTYRSPRACRDRHDALADPDRARRKQKKPPAARRRADDDAPRPPLQRMDAMRDASERRRQAPKRRLDDSAHHNPKHAALLADHGVDYDSPLAPMEVAVKRADRIAKEKQKAGTAAPAQATAAAPPTAVAAPQRIVVAAAAAPKAEAARRPRAPAPAAVEAARASSTAHMLYRQQAITARHLKILHQAKIPHPQTVASTASGSSGGAAAGGDPSALRTVQLQQLALGRALPAPRPPAPRLLAAARHPHSHVVVAHLAPAAPPPSQPSDRAQ